METIDYKIIYSKRRSVSLSVSPEGELVVRASLWHPKSLIERFVVEHEEWIVKALTKVREQQKNKKQFTEGELFLYLGQEYELKILEGYRRRLEFQNGFFLSKHLQYKGKKLFEQFYKEKAKEVLLERALFYAGQMGVSFKKLNITSAGTRWGSCSSSGSINFSWKLIMASLEIIDYVVVHELAHITHKNHSQKFWQLVEKFYPEFKSSRAWLKTNGNKLSI